MLIHIEAVYSIMRLRDESGVVVSKLTLCDKSGQIDVNQHLEFCYQILNVLCKGYAG